MIYDICYMGRQKNNKTTWICLLSAYALGTIDHAYASNNEYQPNFTKHHHDVTSNSNLNRQSNLIGMIPIPRRQSSSRQYTSKRRRNNTTRLQSQPSSTAIQVTSKRKQMYLTCFAIVFIWQTLGTLFYSYYYHWPIPQSFFYSVDAGMSIGFCTDVHETEIGSRAFTIIHILLGASCVGGALILMVSSVLDGVASKSSAVYKLILERDSLSKAFLGTKRGRFGSSVLCHPFNWVDEKEVGVLSYSDFRKVLYNNGKLALNDKEFHRVCSYFDPQHEGCIRYDYFIQNFHGIHKIVPMSRFVHCKSFLTRIYDVVSNIITNEYNRIYLIFVLWVGMGITWGMKSQHWDIITATHFAVSALATGGLTAPPVDSTTGILPTGPALFCGFYCLFGIPLMALTLANFARVLVSGYIVREELAAITRPLTQTECVFAAKSLCSTDPAIHLSDYVVLQLMRQGKLSIESFEFMKRQYELMDQKRFWIKVADQDPL